MKMYKERGLRLMPEEKLRELAIERLGEAPGSKDEMVSRILASQGSTEEFTGGVRVDQMNDLAERIWAGQSISEPLIWRVGRIKEALADKGYSDILHHLELPEAGFKKYM